MRVYMLADSNRLSYNKLALLTRWHVAAHTCIYVGIQTMNSVALLSHKGGTGKTTLALHLSVAATLANYVTVVIDLDPQVSATEWGDSRAAEMPAVVSAQSSRLEQVMQRAEDEGVEIVFSP